MHEIVEDFRTDTYRAVYTVQFADVVYVLHVFQKKSKRGAETPRSEVELIKSRLKLAKEHYEGWRQGNESTKKINVTPSGGNVFADLGLPEAENRLLKEQLALKIQPLIDQKGMTQAEIAPLLGLDQPKVSNLMRGRPAGFSAERLFGILNRLGHNVEVRISEEEHEPEDTYTTVVA